MDPVQYIIHLLTQGKSRDEAEAHARQRYGLTREELNNRVNEAVNAARSLMVLLGSGNEFR